MSTGFSIPSRSSSLDPVDGITQSLCGLLIAPPNVFGGISFEWKPEHRLYSGITEFGPTPGSSRQASQRSGIARGAGSPSLQTTSQQGFRRSSVAGTPLQPDKVIEGRVTKKAGVNPAGSKREATQSLPFGCPMVKGDRARYEGVNGPCTDLKGITSTPKALMEHLKKQHSRDYRCMICWKWHKSQDDLDSHRSAKPGALKCINCCKPFKKREELAKHSQDDCKLDPLSRPELFSDAQEEAFKNMKNKSATHGTLETKFRWIFGQLFPNHPKKKTIWPFYDYAILTHKLPFEMTEDQLPELAGGLRRDPAAVSPPSEPSDPLSSPNPPATTDNSPVLERHASVDFSTAVQPTMRSQNTFSHSQDFNIGFDTPAFQSQSTTMMLGPGHGQRATSFDSTAPALTNDTHSVLEQPPLSPTPLNVVKVPQNLPPAKDELPTQPMWPPHFVSGFDINTSMPTSGPSFDDFTIPGQSQSPAMYHQNLGGPAFNAQGGMSMQQGVTFNPQSLQRTPTTLDPFYHQKLALGPLFEHEYNPFFHGPLVPEASGDFNLDQLQQNPGSGAANAGWDQPQ